MSDIISTEQAVIGGLLLLQDPSLDAFQKVMSTLKESSFKSRQNGLIYSAIKNLGMKGVSTDMLVVESYLDKSGKLTEAGGFAYLAEIAGNVKSAANVIVYANLVREDAINRVANTKLQGAIALLNDPNGGTIYEKLGLIESEIDAILSRGLQNKETGLVHVKEISEKWLDEVESRLTNQEATMGYTTGIESIDKILYPKYIPKGALVVVGGRPKSGKSSILNTFIKQFALTHKKAIATFSLEMTNQQILEKLLVERARVNPDILYCGANSDDEFAKVQVALGEYIDSQLYIDDTPSINLSHVQRESRKLAKKEPLGLIAVDYLTLMGAEKAERNDLAYGIITKGLKALAKELNCVVLLLTQLNRSLESRPDKRPKPSDSRDTGQIEQDCDLWIGLYRESVYKDVQPGEEGLTEAIIRLNRNGKTGTGYLNLQDGYFVEAQPFNFEENSKYDDF